MPRHRHQEFIRFIATVERSVPAGKVIHAILDNYAAHKHPNVLAWLADHPRWTFHFTPTSCSWLNAVEGFLSKLTRQSLQRGVFRSVEDLETAITRYIAVTNRNPKPFVWTATAKAITAKRAMEISCSRLRATANSVLGIPFGVGPLIQSAGSPFCAARTYRQTHEIWDSGTSLRVINFERRRDEHQAN